jgi:hypothetical protein
MFGKFLENVAVKDEERDGYYKNQNTVVKFDESQFPIVSEKAVPGALTQALEQQKVAVIPAADDRDSSIQDALKAKVRAAMNFTPDNKGQVTDAYGINLQNVSDGLTAGSKVPLEEVARLSAIARDSAPVSPSQKISESDRPINIDDKLAEFHKIMKEHGGIEVTNAGHTPETQIAAEIENAVSPKGIKNTSELISAQLGKLISKGGNIREVAMLIKREGENRVADEEADLKISELVSQIENLQNQEDRYEINFKSMSEKLVILSRNGDSEGTTKLADEIAREARHMKLLQEQIANLQRENTNLTNESKINKQERDKALEQKRVSLSERKVNINEVLNIINSVEAIKSTTEIKANEVGLTTVSPDTNEGEVALENNLTVPSIPVAIDSGIANTLSLNANPEKPKAKTLISLLKSRFTKIAGLGLGAMAAMGLYSVNAEKVEAVKNVPTTQVEKVEQKEEVRQIPLNQEGAYIKLPDGGMAVFNSAERGDEYQALTLENGDKVLLAKENKSVETGSKISEYLRSIPTIEALANDGDISILKKIINNLNDRGITGPDKILKKAVADYMSKNKVESNQKNFESILDQVLTQLMLKDKEFSVNKRQINIGENKVGYVFNDIKVGEKVSTEKYIKFLERSLYIQNWKEMSSSNNN